MPIVLGLFPALGFWNLTPGQGRGVLAWPVSPSAAQLRRFQLDFFISKKGVETLGVLWGDCSPP